MVFLQLVDAIQNAFDADVERDFAEIEQLADCLLNFFQQNQAIVRVASATQERLNRLLGRSQPVRTFTAADIDIHTQLQQLEERSLPYLLDEIQDLLQADIEIVSGSIRMTPRVIDALAVTPAISTHSTSILLTE